MFSSWGLVLAKVCSLEWAAMRKVFINDFGRLRSGWRVLIFCAAFLGIALLVGTIIRIIWVNLFELGYARYFEALAPVGFHAIILVAALGGGFVCARWVEGLPWRSLGLTFHQRWLRDLLVGWATGFVALAVAVAIATAAGGLRFSFGGAGTIMPVGRSLVGAALILFIPALAEESLFRGYPLQTFARARLAWIGVLATLIFFGYVHLTNPNVVPGLTFINTSLAGLWLAVGYLRTRSLWFPLGLHWSWNWALGAFFGLPVSGLNLASNPLLKGNDLGPTWLTGGSYGIEGGVACTLALIVFTFLTWRLKWVSATPELKKLTSEENPALQSAVPSTRVADEAV